MDALGLTGEGYQGTKDLLSFVRYSICSINGNFR